MAWGTLKRTVTRACRCVVQPGDRLYVIWFALLLPVARWGGPRVFVIVLIAPFVLGLVAMAVLGWKLPPPRPLSESSALLKRLGWFARALLSAALFACAAVLGAWVSMDLSRAQASDELMRLSWESAYPVVLFGGFFVGIATMMGLVVDLWRSGPARRSETIWSLTAPMARHTVTQPLRLWVNRWLNWLTNRINSVMSAYMSPLVVVAIWAYGPSLHLGSWG